MTLLLAAFSALSIQSSDGPPEVHPVREAAAAVSIWMNNDRRYREGDRVRVQVDADVNGFLLVLHYDPSGRLRVLFPYEPRDDARVFSGRRYEVRADNYDGAFRAGMEGTGLIYSAISPEPWQFDDIVLADRWDLTRLEIDIRSDDPEPEITSLVQRLAGPGGFDYDVMGYRVYGNGDYPSYTTYVYSGRPVYVYADDWYCGSWSWRYDGCSYWPYRSGFYFGLGFYNPYYYGYNYYPYRYRFGYNWPSRPLHRGPFIAGRPRGYTVVPRGTIANRTFGSGTTWNGTARGPTRGTGILPSDGRTRGSGRPAREGVDRNRPGSDGSNVAPPARRNPGREYSRPEDRGGPTRGDPVRARGDNGRREAPPARAEPSRREPPAARSAPPRNDPPRARGERSRGSPPAARSESRREAPPARVESGRREAPPSSARGNGGGSSRGNGGGGSAPARSRGRRGG